MKINDNIQSKMLCPVCLTTTAGENLQLVQFVLNSSCPKNRPYGRLLKSEHLNKRFQNAELIHF